MPKQPSRYLGNAPGSGAPGGRLSFGARALDTGGPRTAMLANTLLGLHLFHATPVRPKANTHIGGRRLVAGSAPFDEATGVLRRWLVLRDVANALDTMPLVTRVDCPGAAEPVGSWI